MKDNKSEVYAFVKEFFKPTKWKIILTVILMLILFLLKNATFITMLFYLPIIVSSQFDVVTSGGFDVAIRSTFISEFLFILIYALEVYIISCLITFASKKIKSSKHE